MTTFSAVGLQRVARATWRHRIPVAQLRLAVASAAAGVLPPYTSNWLRVGLWRVGGVHIGERTGMGGRLWVAGGPDPASRLEIGDDCFLNDGCRFDVSARIAIGSDVFIGHDVALLTASHEVGGRRRRAGSVRSEPITVERGSWIGARSTILAGVTIGEGAIVAAGSVVTRSVAANSLVAGVPAVVVRQLD